MNKNKPKKKNGNMITVTVYVGHEKSEFPNEWESGMWFARGTWEVSAAALHSKVWYLPNGGIAHLVDGGYHMGTADIVVNLLLHDLESVIGLLVDHGYLLGQKGAFEDDGDAMASLKRRDVPLRTIPCVPSDEVTKTFA